MDKKTPEIDKSAERRRLFEAIAQAESFVSQLAHARRSNEAETHKTKDYLDRATKHMDDLVDDALAAADRLVQKKK